MVFSKSILLHREGHGWMGQKEQKDPSTLRSSPSGAWRGWERSTELAAEDKEGRMHRFRDWTLGVGES